MKRAVISVTALYFYITLISVSLYSFASFILSVSSDAMKHYAQ